MAIDVVNVEQAQAWDGADGAHWTLHESRYDSSTAAHADHMLQAASIQPDDGVLDIGCGCGATTRAAAALAHKGHALGVDLSQQMITRARERAAEQALDNVTFLQADAQVHRFEATAFDVAMSKYGAMFFADPVAAFTNIAGAVRPGGRLAMLVWQEIGVNPWVMQTRAALAAGRDLPAPPASAPGPFGLADPEHVHSVLGGAGWRDIKLSQISEPVRLGGSPDDAFAFVSSMGIAKGLLDGLDTARRAMSLQRLRETLSAATTDRGVALPSRSWLIEARRAA